MKKFIAIILLVVCCVCLCGCKADKPQSLKLYAPDGAPCLAVANIFADRCLGDYAVDCQIVAGVDIRAKVLNGEADIAVLPTNMAVSLYNSGCNYVMTSVNVWGVLYLVGRTQLTDLDELIGKVVYSIGLANTPEYVFKTILDSNGVPYCEHGTTEVADKVMIDYSLADGSKIIPKLLSGEVQYAILGEPAVTNAIAKCQQKGITLYNVFDLQSLWDKVFVAKYPQYATQSSYVGYPQACVVVKKSLATDEFVTTLLQKLQQNSQYIEQNASSLAEILGTGTQYTAQTVAKCNIGVVQAINVKQRLEQYLDAINDVTGTNIAHPNDGFYYGK